MAERSETPQCIYVLEKNEAPQTGDRDQVLYAGVTTRWANVWGEILPIPRLPTEKVHPYIAVRDLEKVSSLEELQALIRKSREGLKAW